MDRNTVRSRGSCSSTSRPTATSSSGTQAEKRKRALNAKALGKLASLAGIEKVREDFDWMDGTGVKVTVTGRQRGPDGTWKVNQASKVVRFARLERKVRREAIESAEADRPRPRRGLGPKRIPVALTDDDLEKRIDDEMEHIDQKVSTKAWSRVIRSLLSLPATFTEAQLRKPFFTLAWVVTPDYANPHVARVIDVNFREASRDLYAARTSRPRCPPRWSSTTSPTTTSATTRRDPRRRGTESTPTPSPRASTTPTTTGPRRRPRA